MGSGVGFVAGMFIAILIAPELVVGGLLVGAFGGAGAGAYIVNQTENGRDSAENALSIPADRFLRLTNKVHLISQRIAHLNNNRQRVELENIELRQLEIAKNFFERVIRDYKGL